MQQYYPTNLDNDPIRNTQIKSSELLPRKNIFTMMKNNNAKTFNNSSNKQQPDLYRENIFTENYNRNDGLNEEMIEKDKRIQELEFKLQQIEHEKDSFKNKLGIIKKYEEDNKNLSMKLRQEYEKNKEIINLKNKLSLFEKSKKTDDKIISELRKKLNIIESDEHEEGIILNIDDTTNNDSEDEGIKDIDYDEIYKKTLEEESKRSLNLEKYKNDKLKDIISKYIIGIGDEGIDNLFIKYKIDEKTEITKELISKIISELKQ
tara:strand:+ start:952 stop:1737 length:786 start_codon:yes stop_codon:yes gene_type:complete